MSEFLQNNSSFLMYCLTMIGACGSATLVYMLKSRCTSVRCGCVACEREPLPPENVV